ncbi:hypothetical protein I4U23_031374 [Adineta vaga]|nr:hypothetical protein I4U23_031374 [Adineta vaga]
MISKISLVPLFINAAIDDQCLACICQVESGCRPLKCCWNVYSNSCGYYQLKQDYWQDCGSLEACAVDKNCSDKCVRMYMQRYASRCTRGRTPTCQDYARIHNGGPNGCDLYGIQFDSFWCTFRGYLISVMCSNVYQAFGIQAFFRLCRIIYPQLWQDIDYLPKENYCYVTFSKPRGIIYVIFTTYGIPLSILFSHYVRITIFIRHLPNNQTIVIRHQQKRDLLAIRRIFLHVFLLLTLVIPGMILTLIKFISGNEYYLTYRILWLGSEVSVAILTIEMILITPQLKNIFINRWRQNRVTTFNQTIQRGHVTTIQ